MYSVSGSWSLMNIADPVEGKQDIVVTLSVFPCVYSPK